MTETGDKATANNPKQIEWDTKAAWRAVTLSDLSTKGPEAEQANLECLQRPRNTYDGDSQR